MRLATRRRPRAANCCAALALLLVLPSRAGAQDAPEQGRDLSLTQPSSWYLTHSSLTLALAGLAWGVGSADPGPARWTTSPPFEAGLRGRTSAVARAASDGALLASALAPPLGFGDAARISNGLIVYGEALALDAAVTATLKHFVARARPDAAPPGATADPDPDDARSFPSGHASLSFGAAASGAALTLSGPLPAGAARALVGFEFGLAAFTAHARVRAGRHYPTDALAGAALGAALGFAVPLLHDVRLELEAQDCAALAGGLVAGVGLAALLPRPRRTSPLAQLTPLVLPVEQGALLAVSGELR